MSRIAELVGKAPVFLHFDINRTIIQVDPAGGKSLIDIMNNNVASDCFGEVVDGKWKVLYGPTDAVPEEEQGTLVSYDDFVDSIYPKPEGMDKMSSTEAAEVWAEVSGKRRYLKKVFTHAGEPGEQFQPFVQKQLDLMRIPNSEENHYVIPSFYKTVNALSEHGVNFAVIIRTFGHDLPQVMNDIKNFASGNHPIKCTPAAAERLGACTEPKTAALYRDESGMYCSVGVTKAAPLMKERTTGTMEYLCGLPGYSDTKPVCHRELVRLIEGELQSGLAGFVDFYPWWAAHGESAAAGKVFPVYTDPTAQTPYHVFFDDNVFPGDQHSIIDLRSVETGEAVADIKMHDAHTLKVKPLQAIGSEDYFMDALERMIDLQKSMRKLNTKL